MGPLDVGESLLELCEAHGSRSIAVVGTAKNVGKTVVVRTLCGALQKHQRPFGVASVGRDGEAIDAVDAMPKPRLRLEANVFAATARDALSPSPACEILEVSDMATALGAIVFIRTRAPANIELVGPPNASAMHRVKRRLFAHGAQRVIIDGAVDRLAALAGEDDAVIVATGASAAATLEAAATQTGALVRRLQTPAFDPARPFVRIAGVLDSARSRDINRRP